MMFVWMLVGVALSAQVGGLIFWGHSTYLWIQGVEAAIASVLLLHWRVRYRAGAQRASRWPPLTPLASIAAAGAIKNFCVVTRPETPVWVAAWLLLSVGWFLIASVVIWKAGSGPQPGTER